MPPPVDALLLIAHGTVRDTSELPQFLAKIRRGRPAPEGLVAELTQRYNAIGGSPLLETTRQQAQALSERLDLPCHVAMRMWHPFVEEILPEAVANGAKRFLTLPLAPYSVNLYCSSTAELASEWAKSTGTDITLHASQSWAAHPAFVQAQVDLIAPHLEQAGELILTAHSLPERVIRAGDQYQAEVESCATAIGEKLGRGYHLAYQSAGADGGPWVGPSLLQTMTSLKEAGKSRVVVAPIGFVADHVETLYDLDIEAKAQAEELGLGWARVPAVNTQTSFMNALEQIARENLNAL